LFFNFKFLIHTPGYFRSRQFHWKIHRTRAQIFDCEMFSGM
jgi:hypothetical protein